MTCSYVSFYSPAHLKSVHNRHHNIRNDDVGYVFQGTIQSDLSIKSLNNIVLSGKSFSNVTSNVVIVLDDKHYPFGLFVVTCSLLFIRQYNFIQMNCIGIILICRNAECENRTCSELTIHRYLTAMQFYQRFDKCKSYSCAGSLVSAVSLVIAFEYMRQRLLINTASSVCNLCFSITHPVVYNHAH